MKDHKTARVSFLAPDWQITPLVHLDYLPFEKSSSKPENHFDIIMISEELSHDFAFLRVDMYEINHKVFFGAIFFAVQRFYAFLPEVWDM